MERPEERRSPACDFARTILPQTSAGLPERNRPNLARSSPEVVRNPLRCGKVIPKLVELGPESPGIARISPNLAAGASDSPSFSGCLSTGVGRACLRQVEGQLFRLCHLCLWLLRNSVPCARCFGRPYGRPLECAQSSNDDEDCNNDDSDVDAAADDRDIDVVIAVMSRGKVSQQSAPYLVMQARIWTNLSAPCAHPKGPLGWPTLGFATDIGAEEACAFPGDNPA